MSNVTIDLTKTVKEIIETMKTAIDNLNTNVDSLKSEVLLAAHPVGSYYISDNATDPGTLFGGTWEMLDPGLTLISQGKGTDKFGSFEFVAGQTYGERMHQLTVEELPKNYISFRTIAWIGDNSNRVNVTTTQEKYDLGSTLGGQMGGVTFILSGGGLATNNVMPSRAVYIWLRTA